MNNRYWKAVTGILPFLVLVGLLSGCGAMNERTVTTAMQLNDSSYSVGVAQGASSQTVVEQELPNAKAKYYTRDADAYMSVQQGKIDAFVYDRVTMEFAIASGLTGVKLLPDKIGEPISIAVGISPESEVPEIQSKLNEFLAEIRADGTLDECRGGNFHL